MIILKFTSDGRQTQNIVGECRFTKKKKKEEHLKLQL